MLAVGSHLNTKWDDASARKWLDELDIPLDARVRNLSGGQQAQVALAVCMAKQPDLLAARRAGGQPGPIGPHKAPASTDGTGGRTGTTVLLSSHIISELEPVCDYLIILSSSRVQLAAKTDDLLAEHRLLVGPASEAVPSEAQVIATNSDPPPDDAPRPGEPPSARARLAASPTQPRRGRCRLLV